MRITRENILTGGDKKIPGLANPKYWRQPHTEVIRDNRERVNVIEAVIETYRDGRLVNKRVVPIGAYKSNVEEMRAITRAREQFVPRRTPNGTEVVKLYQIEYVVNSYETPKVMLLWEGWPE